MRIVRQPSFTDDLSDAYAYLANQNSAAADRLLDAVEALVELLAAFPDLGRVRDEISPGVRSFRVRRFRYVLWYRRDAEAITLVRLLHGARDT